MLYGGIKIEETQSIIVILGEDNKLFIPHDIIVANNTTDIQNFVNSMQRGGITPEKICFAINPVHVNSIETFNSFRQIFMQAAYDLRIINTAAQGDSFIVVTKSRNANEEATANAFILKHNYNDSKYFLQSDFRQSYFYNCNLSDYFNLIFTTAFMFIAIYFLYCGILLAVLHFLISAGLTICYIRHMYFVKMSIKKHTPIFSIDKNGLQQNYKIRWSFLEPLKIPRTISWKQIEKIETYKPIICINHDNNERISICVAGQSEITLNFFVIGIDHEHNYRTLLFYWKLFRNNGQ